MLPYFGDISLKNVGLILILLIKLLDGLMRAKELLLYRVLSLVIQTERAKTKRYLAMTVQMMSHQQSKLII